MIETIKWMKEDMGGMREQTSHYWRLAVLKGLYFLFTFAWLSLALHALYFTSLLSSSNLPSELFLLALQALYSSFILSLPSPFNRPPRFLFPPLTRHPNFLTTPFTRPACSLTSPSSQNSLILHSSSKLSNPTFHSSLNLFALFLPSNSPLSLVPPNSLFSFVPFKLYFHSFLFL